jgi:hypothetical protein
MEELPMVAAEAEDGPYRDRDTKLVSKEERLKNVKHVGGSCGKRVIQGRGPYEFGEIYVIYISIIPVGSSS